MIEQRLRHDSPAKIFRECVENGTASVHVVRMCLDTQRNQEEWVERRCREPLLAAQRQERLASMVLQHIWRSDSWPLLVFFVPRTVANLCYYAVLEGLEDLLLDWMIMDTTDMNLEQRADFWRGALFRKIVGAHLSLDTNANAGPAIQCCIKVAKQKDAAYVANTESRRNHCRIVAQGKHPIMVTPIRPIIVDLHATLCTPYCYNTDPDVFE